MQNNVIKFVSDFFFSFFLFFVIFIYTDSDFRQINDLLHALRFPSPLKLTAMI